MSKRTKKDWASSMDGSGVAIGLVTVPVLYSCEEWCTEWSQKDYEANGKTLTRCDDCNTMIAPVEEEEE